MPDYKRYIFLCPKKQLQQYQNWQVIGIDKLENKVYNKIWSGKVQTSNQLMLNNVRHKDAIERAIASLCRAEDVMPQRLSPEFLSIDIRESISALGEIVGQTYTDDILDVIF